MFSTKQFSGVLLVKHPLVFMCSTEQRIKTRKKKKKNSGQNRRISEQTLFNRGKEQKRGQLLKAQKRKRQACRRLCISFIKTEEIQTGETERKIKKGRGNLTFYTHGQNTKEQIRLSETRWSEDKVTEEK